MPSAPAATAFEDVRIGHRRSDRRCASNGALATLSAASNCASSGGRSWRGPAERPRRGASPTSSRARGRALGRARTDARTRVRRGESIGVHRMPWSRLTGCSRTVIPDPQHSRRGAPGTPIRGLTGCPEGSVRGRRTGRFPCRREACGTSSRDGIGIPCVGLQRRASSPPSGTVTGRRPPRARGPATARCR